MSSEEAGLSVDSDDSIENSFSGSSIDLPKFDSDQSEVNQTISPTIKQKKARSAFKKRISSQSKSLHQSSVEHHQAEGRYLKSVVYGGLDGIITTFAVVASVSGAKLKIGVLILMGFANLLADGISMGMGDFLSSKAESDYRKAERKREIWECENYLEGEKKEMVDLYVNKGIDREDAITVVNLLSKNKEAFVDVMMVEELGIVDEGGSALVNGLVTFGSFLIFGLIPLVAYIIAIVLFPDSSESGLDWTFLIASCLTGSTMFALGCFTSKFTSQHWLLSGCLMLLNGGLAAFFAFLVGFLLSELFEV